jgi:hypothetical protein
VTSYAVGMGALILRLLLLFAVLAMPFGMSAAPAATVGHHSAASMPMEHCPEQNTGHDRKGGIAECTMACSVALPAAVTVVARQPLTTATQLVLRADAERLHGLHPETLTPPPRKS